MVTTGDIGFLFPGQGAQFPGMALDLYERSAVVQSLFRTAAESTGLDFYALLRDEDPDKLKRTDLSQPAITLANLAAAAALAENGVKPMLCAGFSLGEYAALAIAEVISVVDCFKLVAARGRVMQAAVDRLTEATAIDGAAGRNPGMAAVLGLEPEAVEKLIAEWRADGLRELYAANYNSPTQTVVSGTAEALEEAEIRFKSAGARRYLRLKVAGPFHSPLMAEAAADFATALQACSFADPRIPLFSNVTGALIVDGAKARALALRQITEPVRWTLEEAAIAEMRPAQLLEVGPGKVLQGLWKDFGSAIPCRGAGTTNDIYGGLL